VHHVFPLQRLQIRPEIIVVRYYIGNIIFLRRLDAGRQRCIIGAHILYRVDAPRAESIDGIAIAAERAAHSSCSEAKRIVCSVTPRVRIDNLLLFSVKILTPPRNPDRFDV